MKKSHVDHGRLTLRKWREDRELSLLKFGDQIADLRGDQVRKFEVGDRPLPIPLAASIALRTEIPMHLLLTDEQFETAGRIRDALEMKVPGH